MNKMMKGSECEGGGFVLVTQGVANAFLAKSACFVQKLRNINRIVWNKPVARQVIEALNGELIVRNDVEESPRRQGRDLFPGYSVKLKFSKTIGSNNEMA